jgi:hypothetical protein
VADYIREHPSTKPLVRSLLMPAVVVALFLLGSTGAAKGFMGALLAAFIAASLRRRRRRNHCLRGALWLGALVLVALCGAPAASAQDDLRQSPHWNYEIRAVYFEPDLELFETFYGSDTDVYPAGVISYRLLDRLELGGEYGLMKEKGVGLLTETGELGGSVELRLDVFHVFANVIFERSPTQRVVPYLGAGLLGMRYEQEVEFQSEIDGSTDLGWAARAGLRFRLASHGPEQFRGSSGGSPYWRAFLFVEAQRMSAKVDDTELGGNAAAVGFRMEFDAK